MNPEHYQGTVMRSEPQYATDESWEGEGSSEAESGYVMQFLSLGVEMGVVSKKWPYSLQENTVFCVVLDCKSE